MTHTGSVCLLTSWIPITFTSSTTRELLRSLHMAKVETYKSIFPKSLAQLLELAGQNACFSHLLYPPSQQRDGAVSSTSPYLSPDGHGCLGRQCIRGLHPLDRCRH